MSVLPYPPLSSFLSEIVTWLTTLRSVFGENGLQVYRLISSAFFFSTNNLCWPDVVFLQQSNLFSRKQTSFPSVIDKHSHPPSSLSSGTFYSLLLPTIPPNSNMYDWRRWLTSLKGLWETWIFFATSQWFEWLLKWRTKSTSLTHIDILFQNGK